jgi:hypothetical protein
MIQTFNEFYHNRLLAEGFLIKDDLVVFEPSSDAIINTSFGKGNSMEPYGMKLPFGQMFSVYKKASSADKKEYQEVLSALKGQSSQYTMDPDSYDKFLKRTALYLSKIVTQNRIDTIIVLDTSSKLLPDLIIKMNRYLPKYYDIHTYNRGLFKNPNISEIEISTQYNMQDKTVRELRRVLDKAKQDQYFSIKKIPTQFRQVIKNWLILNDKILSKIVDKNVMIVDDIITTGTTAKEAASLIQDAGAASLIGVSIIKGI